MRVWPIRQTGKALLATAVPVALLACSAPASRLEGAALATPPVAESAGVYPLPALSALPAVAGRTTADGPWPTATVAVPTGRADLFRGAGAVDNPVPAAPDRADRSTLQAEVSPEPAMIRGGGDRPTVSARSSRADVSRPQPPAAAPRRVGHPVIGARWVGIMVVLLTVLAGALLLLMRRARGRADSRGAAAVALVNAFDTRAAVRAPGPVSVASTVPLLAVGDAVGLADTAGVRAATPADDTTVPPVTERTGLMSGADCAAPAPAPAAEQQLPPPWVLQSLHWPGVWPGDDEWACTILASGHSAYRAAWAERLPALGEAMSVAAGDKGAGAAVGDAAPQGMQAGAQRLEGNEVSPPVAYDEDALVAQLAGPVRGPTGGGGGNTAGGSGTPRRTGGASACGGGRSVAMAPIAFAAPCRLTEASRGRRPPSVPILPQITRLNGARGAGVQPWAASKPSTSRTRPARTDGGG